VRNQLIFIKTTTTTTTGAVSLTLKNKPALSYARVKIIKSFG
jgi:hypothetical protein